MEYLNSEQNTEMAYLQVSDNNILISWKKHMNPEWEICPKIGK